MGSDNIKEYDEVYYNIIGNDWGTTISRVEFKIVLPKSFDTSKLNFTMGRRGSTDNSNIVWNIKDNIIEGYTTKSLKPHESLTIALPLEKGYFSIPLSYIIVNEIVNFFDKVLNLMFLFPIASFFIVINLIFCIFIQIRKREKIIETVEFYPPDNLTPSEIGFIIDNSIESFDITSMIFYWVNKGYIKITNIEIESNTKLIKVSDIVTEKRFEKYLFDSIFSFSEKIDEETVVEISKLNEKFYNHLDKTKKLLRKDFTSKFLNESTLSFYEDMYKLMVLIFLIFVVICVKERYVFSWQFLIMLPITIAIFSKIKIYLKRTKYGQIIYGRCLGFKRFLNVAEKNKLEILLTENPNYFYDILPYAICMNIVDIWKDKFIELTTDFPNCTSDNYKNDFYLKLHSNIDRILSAKTSSGGNTRTSGSFSFGSSGRSSSRGGFSGGGRGGGGGGSW